MSFKEQYEKIKEPAIKVIADYLLTRDDVNLEKENKTLEEMWRYILGIAKEKAVENCACLSDEEVFGLAVHYYDEDDLKVEKPKAKAVVKKENPMSTMAKELKEKQKNDDIEALARKMAKEMLEAEKEAKKKEKEEKKKAEKERKEAEKNNQQLDLFSMLGE